MGKKLAIRGHATRGKEVIELLKMMGAKHFVLDGTHDWYVINDLDNSITFYDHNYINCHEYVKFTLEEFLEKYPHKVGDSVVDCYGDSRTIKSMGWLEDLETMVYAFEENSVVLAAKDIRFAYDNTTPTKETITPAPDITANVTDKNNCDIQCPDGYEFYDEKGNLIGTKVMMRPKKPVYPNDYEECVRIAKNIHGYDINIDAPAYRGLMESFIKLLVCRDAYWKIAGEELGLGKPWKPDWTNEEQKKYCIYYSDGNIQKGTWCLHNSILAFPSEEMRDAFYENFKDLIESCKELL